MSERFILIGHPLRHSVSPALHQAAYRALDLPHRYELCDAPDELAVRRAMDDLRSGAVRGANVTIPHKKLALELSDAADPLARQVGAANVLARRSDGAVVAHNTDVAALAGELSALKPGLEVAAVIGSGGAALAAVVACQAAGAARVGVVARKWRSGQPPEAWPEAAKFRALGATPMPWPDPPLAGNDVWQAFAATCDALVQATSAGMAGADNGEIVRDIVPWSRLPRGALAYDLVYNPAITPFLEAARALGLTVDGGLGMLVEQAALSVQLWLGLSPPRQAMREAAERVLAARIGEP